MVKRTSITLMSRMRDMRPPLKDDSRRREERGVERRGDAAGWVDWDSWRLQMRWDHWSTAWTEAKSTLSMAKEEDDEGGDDGNDGDDGDDEAA